MFSSKVLRWGLCLLAFCFFGCSAVNVDIGSTVDWSKVSSVALQPQQEDPWQLAPEIRAELQKMGLTVLAEDDATADLLVRFFFKEGPDLNADGDLLTRLKSFHIQFVDPATETFVAVADYFYADSLSDQTGESVEEAFAALRQDIQAGSSPQRAPTPNAAIKTAPIAPQPQVVSPVATPRPSPQPDEPVIAHKDSPPAQDSQTTVPAEALTEATDSPRAAEQPPEAIVPEIDKSKARKIAPRTASPWVPRFDSWGFENWGDQPDDGY